MKKKHSQIVKRKDFLNLLAKSKSKKRREALINLADTNELKSLVEIFLNAIYGNLPLPKSLVKRMKKYKSPLRELVHRGTSIKRKKQILKKSQVGGILPLLIPLLAGLSHGL
jgi:hypothetical protein